jgi:hypothetical protein
MAGGHLLQFFSICTSREINPERRPAFQVLSMLKHKELQLAQRKRFLYNRQLSVQGQSL